jgi:hypothetical protein
MKKMSDNVQRMLFHKKQKQNLEQQLKENEDFRKVTDDDPDSYNAGYLHGFSDALVREIKWQQQMIEGLKDE